MENTMQSPITISIPVGVVVAKERIDHPWQEFRWRPVSVFLNAPEDPDWRVLMQGEGFIHYHAATLPLELHRKETANYLVNLAKDAPEIYVVLRELEEHDARGIAVEVHLATASPTEPQAHGHGGDEIIETVAMPDALRDIVAEFVAAHHKDEPFIKRRRDGKRRDEEQQLFGKEPLEVQRARQAASQGGDDA